MTTPDQHHTPLHTSATMQIMPPWAQRRHWTAVTWWGRFDVDKSLAARITVIDPEMPLADVPGEVEQGVRSAAPMRPRVIAGVLAAGIAGVGAWLLSGPAMASVIIGALLLIIGMLGLGGIGRDLAHSRAARRPAASVTAELSELTWTAARHLSSYRTGPDSQRNQVRRLLYAIATAANLPQAPALRDALVTTCHRVSTWTELPADDLGTLTRQLWAASRQP